MLKTLDKSIFETEIKEHLRLKSRSTQKVYIPAFPFLKFFPKELIMVSFE
jgi:hypothetical protein